MSVKRITDLPAVDTIEKNKNLTNFNESFLELSYRDDTDTFVSRKMQVNSFAEALGLETDEPTELTGNCIYNEGDSGTLTDTYQCQLNFGRTSIRTLNDVDISALGIVDIKTTALDVKTSAGESIAHFNESGLDMDKHAVTNVKDPVDDSDAVTLDYLKQQLADLKAELEAEIANNKPKDFTLDPNEVLSSVYPVGSIYITTQDSSTCPLSAVITGSRWEKVGANHFLKSVNSDAGKVTAGKTTIGSGDISLGTTSAKAVLYDKGHDRLPFLLTVDVCGYKGQAILPPAYNVYVWRRTL